MGKRYDEYFKRREIYRERNVDFLEKGVDFLDIDSVFIDENVEIGRGDNRQLCDIAEQSR